MLVLDGELELVVELDGDIDLIVELDGELGIITKGAGSSYPIYHDITEVTPSEDTQTLSTDGFLMENNIIINPIPTNYGKITWDGTKIIVS